MARKILLADDSVTAQNMGRKILADAGYEVIAVNNGSAALKKIAELKPDLVILDVYMPGYSGLEVCQRLKESQETSRIPVLLSVGKLEPFKPEEAQRVRADGYIVKPFEASELLSALSKLEDKVVPRAEPSKPGRFARAIAAAEESSRGRNQPSADESGWKSRIAFPHEKTEAEAKVADDAPIYNPMNRDLRTVVETAGEKAAGESAKQEETRQQAEAAAEVGVDVAALSHTGLPKDVTPEEVAAIAAAAAQIQMAGAVARQEQQTSETPIIASLESSVPPAAEEPTAVAIAEAKPELAEQAKVESAAAAPVVEEDRRRDEGRAEGRGEESSDEPQDVPMTMAVTAESAAGGNGSRWTAVPVALEGEDASVSLEQEMHRAYTAFVAAETEAVVAARAAELQAASAEAVSATVEPVAEIPQAAAIQDSEPVSQDAPAVSAEVIRAEPATEAFAAEASPVESAPSVPVVEVAQAEAINEAVPAPEFTEANPQTVAEFMSPVSEAEVAGLAGIVGLSAESQLAPEEAPEPKPESEEVKSTAAAWASWRQIRDTNKASETSAVQATEFELPQPAPAEIAVRAAAAGAEQISQEIATVPNDNPTNDNPGDVASIVDSVLADLRPKLMAEITRKMAEKK